MRHPFRDQPARRRRRDLLKVLTELDGGGLGQEIEFASRRPRLPRRGNDLKEERRGAKHIAQKCEVIARR